MKKKNMKGKQAREIDRHLAVVWSDRGCDLSCPGHFEQAIDCFDKALELDSHIANIWFNKGTCLAEFGRCDDALSCFDKTLELDPRNVDAWYNRTIAEDNLSHVEGSEPLRKSAGAVVSRIGNALD